MRSKARLGELSQRKITMKQLRILFLTSMLLLMTLAAPATVAATATPDGTFIAIPTSINDTPVGANCLLTVQGALIFTGRLVGQASAVTQALVFADCSAVRAHPPGTFADVFTSELTFTGSIDGTAVTNLSIIYQGRTAVGGAITGQMRLGNGRDGILAVEGIVAQGGSYWFQTP
jgi:hypothetical protein